MKSQPIKQKKKKKRKKQKKKKGRGKRGKRGRGRRRIRRRDGRQNGSKQNLWILLLIVTFLRNLPAASSSFYFHAFGRIRYTIIRFQERKGANGKKKRIIYITEARIPPFGILLVLFVYCSQRNTLVDGAEIEAYLADCSEGYMTLFSEFYLPSSLVLPMIKQ